VQRVYDEDVNVTESKEGEKQPEDKVNQRLLIYLLCAMPCYFCNGWMFVTLTVNV